jgi:membrane protease YdiL (CAAX protease family)
MVDELLGTILQLAAFTLIPFLVHLIKTRSLKGFLHYIGMRRSARKANLLAVVASLLFAGPILILVLNNPDFLDIMHDPDSITGKFRQMGFSMNAVVILLLIAIFKTALSEEILFRGFIAKRLIAALGFRWGNLLQAALFGIIHTLLFVTMTSNLLFLILIFVFPSVGAWISAYLNEKIAGGSIIPGWISHGLANIMSYSVVGFLI